MISSRSKPGTPYAFILSEVAAQKIEGVIKTLPGNPCLFVFVEVGELVSCTGVRYDLKFFNLPTDSDHLVIESRGIKIAIEKADAKILDGTGLDCAELSSGERGFIFRNPNEKTSSLPSELQENLPKSPHIHQIRGPEYPGDDPRRQICVTTSAWMFRHTIKIRRQE